LSSVKNIILGITGGIAAYKACDLIRLFVKAGIRVHPVMTPSAARFITPLTISYLASNKVLIDFFEEKIDWSVEHVELAQKADLMLVAPATANIIAKIAHGLADDYVSLSALTFAGKGQKPLIIAPAMNFRMYEHPATVQNIKTLRERGVVIVDPEEGELACGEVGAGRLASIDKIHKTVLEKLELSNDLRNVRAIVTAGGTSEPIDPVREITNRSSGKMGYCIATELKNRGATVILITSSSLPDPSVDKIIRFKTASELENILNSEFNKCNLLVMAAAVADFEVKEKNRDKIHRTAENITIELTPTADIIAGLAKQKGDRLIVGFAAETDNLIKQAQSKLESKGIDMVVGNDISRDDIGFGSDYNEVVIVMRNRQIRMKRALKSEIAENIVDEIASII